MVTLAARLETIECSPTGIHWTYDTYALSQGTTRAISRLGAKSWFFLSADYSLGAQLEADSRKVIDATGGKVVGAVKHPINTPISRPSCCRRKPPRRT